MARHIHLEHLPDRRWLRPWSRRCRCGNELPCPVGTVLARQEPPRSAAPAQAWAQPTYRYPTVGSRALLTPGQAARTSHVGRPR